MALMVRARPPWQHLRVALLSLAGASLAAPVVLGWTFAWLPALLLLLTAYVFLVRVEVEVGDEGVMFTPTLSAPRFVRFDEILAVDVRTDVRALGNWGQSSFATHAVVHFALSGGRHLQVATDVRGSRSAEAIHPEATKLIDGVRAHLRPRRPHALDRTLARGGRSADAWLDSLRLLAADAAAYREVSVDEGELLRLVEDTLAPVTVRAGAALLLRNRPTSRARVRIAAERSPLPRLRVALETMVDQASDDEVLTRALAGLHDQ